MEKVLGLILFSLLVIIFSSCRLQSSEQRMKQTGMKVVEAIRSNNPSDFKSLIGVASLRLIGKDQESIQNDVKRLNYLFKRYIENEQIKVEMFGGFNNLGQLPLKIEIIKKVGDSLGVNEMHLNLYFGPPDIVPLNKISGYELVKNDTDSALFVKK